MSIRFVSLRPERAFFRPGEPWRMRLTVRASEPADALIRLQPAWPGGQGKPASQHAKIEARLTELICELGSPPEPERGYLVQATVQTVGGTVSGYGAADVLADWRADPRYGFLSEFAPGDTGQPARAASMAGLHLNCAQFYDWMYRHDRLLPPAAEFRDPIGRSLSTHSVRVSIAACISRGITPLGYAALYAGLPDFAAAHPDWQITDAAGQPEHLAGLFYLMNPADSGWQQHLLGQLDEALTDLGFCGFHLDQYGYPRIAWDRTGRPADVGAGLASLASGAAALVARRRPGGGVIANAVNAWPLDEFATLPQAASYIEVWPPHTRYEDLAALADLARRTARRPVLLAAYPSFLRADPRPAAGPASSGLGLLTAVTLAAGAWPLLAGEEERVLADPYYPSHVSPPAKARATLAQLLDFGVAFRNWLRGPLVRPIEPAFIDGPAAEWQVSLPHSALPQPGHVWLRALTSPGWTVLSLVNLLGVQDASWDRAQPTARATSVTLTLPRHLKSPACWVASPGHGLARVPVADGARVRVPLKLWTLLGVTDSSAGHETVPGGVEPAHTRVTARC